MIERHECSITTNASGNGSYVMGPFTGKLLGIVYTKDATAPYANNVTMLVVTEKTNQTLWTQASVNATATVYPRAPTHSNAGVASLYAAAGEPVEDKYPICNEKITITVDAADGADKAGTFAVMIDHS